MEQFNDRLTALRKNSGMTQGELGKRLHVTTGTVSNYENGVHLPDVEKLVSLADIFGVTTDYLLGRCACPLSPDVLDRGLLAEKTAGAVIQAITRLSPERKQALATILNDMDLLSLLSQHGEQTP